MDALYPGEALHDALVRQSPYGRNGKERRDDDGFTGGMMGCFAENLFVWSELEHE